MKRIMKRLSVIIPVILLAACTLTGCAADGTDFRGKELVVSRYLERAIEVGEKAVEEQNLILHVAVTEGTDAALELDDRLRHHDHYDQFWKLLKQSDSVWMTIPDTAARLTVRSHLTPYLERIIDLAEEVMP